MMFMSATESAKPLKRGESKKVVGLIAIALVIVFTILFTIGILSFIEWIVAEILVALIANIVFRTANKHSGQ
jgi:hypothetical protein